jgi:ubiquinone biosynthesis monooxygenase Coq7
MISDRFIIELDKALRTLFAPATSVREVPGSQEPEPALSRPERAHASALMRINHVGEVCAQALYQGQALTCRDPALQPGAASKRRNEETEHLAWTEQRLAELERAHQSVEPGLVPWRADHRDRRRQGRATTGASAFLAETERQVEAHLDHHLSRTAESGQPIAGNRRHRCDSTRSRMPKPRSISAHANCLQRSSWP